MRGVVVTGLLALALAAPAAAADASRARRLPHPGLTLVNEQLAAGVGYDLGGVSIAGEATWSQLRPQVPGTAPPSWSSNTLGAVSVRYSGAEIQPYLAAMSTLDGEVIAGLVGVEDRR